eukprot:CAMPEP_0181321380 /NCGR_PEP_ID=MMETSP1101-20121128/18649_1 /TAXON_ID=46948 /ORGANISM="Rhodomonas abbreviata, Strain Caron Lab Isolate" /LENGTH=248 /DNA_ID=CAMNT_0023429193 /DNA_START=113 /DNA_END=859 /DNA_ORIENTATION=-
MAEAATDAATGGRGGGAGRGRNRGGRGRVRKEEMVDGNLEPSNPTVPTGSVPPNIKQLLRKLLKDSGPILQAQLTPTWNKANPDTPLNYKEWGFERLKDFIDSMPDLVSKQRDGQARDITITLVGATPAKGAGAGAGGKGEKAIVTQGGDPAAVAKFLSQGKLRFTIDMLVEEFKKFEANAPGKAALAAEGAAGEAPAAEGAPPKKKRNPRQRKERAPKEEGAGGEEAPTDAPKEKDGEAAPAPAAAE